MSYNAAISACKGPHSVYQPSADVISCNAAISACITKSGELGDCSSVACVDSNPLPSNASRTDCVPSAGKVSYNAAISACVSGSDQVPTADECNVSELYAMFKSQFSHDYYENLEVCECEVGKLTLPSRSTLSRAFTVASKRAKACSLDLSSIVLIQLKGVHNRHQRTKGMIPPPKMTSEISWTRVYSKQKLQHHVAQHQAQQGADEISYNAAIRA